MLEPSGDAHVRWSNIEYLSCMTSMVWMEKCVWYGTAHCSLQLWIYTSSRESSKTLNWAEPGMSIIDALYLEEGATLTLRRQ